MDKRTSHSSLIFVKCLENSAAVVEYYLPGGDGSWELDRSADAYIGKNGIGKTVEGDLRTPEGEFGVRSAFGVKPDPGTALPYLQVSDTTVACDGEGPFYNQIVDESITGPCPGERMSELVPEYNYGMALDYNPDNVYPLGSAIFFHCQGRKSWTGGCVAVDEGMMKHILLTCGPRPLVCIRPAKNGEHPH